MRLLLLLPWCFLLALVGATDCNWKMPTETEECTQIIKWKVRSNKQALSTCLEYFPTTFLKGEIHSNKDQIKCTVYRKFQCNFMSGETFTMFDKCYQFFEPEKTMKEYIDNRGKANELCKDQDGVQGGIPVFFTMSQAKHVAMEAHRQKIFKLWVNVKSDGTTIEESKANGLKKGDMLYKNLWKVQEDIYWEGDDIMRTPKTGVPAGNADYLYFRSRTDHVHNLLQGSFERANEKAKASIVCEYQAKIVPDVKDYCEKMGEKGLGMNAKYDDSNGRKRCVYSTLSAFSLKGTKEAIEELGKTACAEKPSNEHSPGLDDGTASKSVYDEVTKDGTYRVAAIKDDTKIDAVNKKAYDEDSRKKGDPSGPTAKQRQVYKVYDHFMKDDFAFKMTSTWNSEYPKNEASDFPAGEMDSLTLAIRNKEIIDVPVPVPFPVLCSIEANKDCEISKEAEKDVCRKDQICTNTKTWNSKTNLYSECNCAPSHEEKADKCNWKLGDGYCGRMHSRELNEWKEVTKDTWTDYAITGWGDQIDKAQVRYGCSMQFWSHPKDNAYNYKLLDVTYGEHVVPQHQSETLNGWAAGMSASSVKCLCT